MPDFTQIAVIVAAGRGLRMKAAVKKQYMTLEGIPVLVRTLQVFDRHPAIDALVLVVPEPELTFCREMTAPFGWAKPLHLVAGGAERQDSVRSGLGQARSLSKDPLKTLVLVHDGVRPFVTHKIIDACLNAARKTGAAIPAVQITDTVKSVGRNGQVDQTLDRSRLVRAQTPQVFRLDLGLAAFEKAAAACFSGTDEASILERYGVDVALVPGSEANIKLTTPGDLVLARFILAQGGPEEID